MTTTRDRLAELAYSTEQLRRMLETTPVVDEETTERAQDAYYGAEDLAERIERDGSIEGRRIG